MAKVAEWSGNAYSDKWHTDKTTGDLIDFCNSFDSIYIYGAGRIGTGFKNYLEQCDVPLRGFITSDTINEFKKIYKKDKAGVIIALSDENINEVIPLIKNIIAKENIFTAGSQYRERMGRYNIEYIRDNFKLGIRLVSHCNVNCKSCTAFSPICQEDYYEYTKLVKDFMQLQKLKLQVKTISLSGGEPYLHPRLFDILKITREIFPDAAIKCITNGTMLSRLNETQLKELHGLDVINQITVYPTCREIIEPFLQKADKYNLKYNIINYDETKHFINLQMDANEYAPKHDFIDCPVTGDNPVLNFFKGKLYRCGRCLFAPHLNNYFNTDFIVSNDDFIDIYNTTLEEIYNFKITRTSFCNYCNSANRELVQWGLSERKIEEWVHSLNGAPAMKGEVQWQK